MKIIGKLFRIIDDEFLEIVNYWDGYNQWFRLIMLILHPLIMIFDIVIKVLPELWITFKILIAWIIIVLMIPWSVTSGLRKMAKVRKIVKGLGPDDEEHWSTRKKCPVRCPYCKTIRKKVYEEMKK